MCLWGTGWQTVYRGEKERVGGDWGAGMGGRVTVSYLFCNQQYHLYSAISTIKPYRTYCQNAKSQFILYEEEGGRGAHALNFFLLRPSKQTIASLIHSKIRRERKKYITLSLYMFSRQHGDSSLLLDDRFCAE